MPGADAVAAHDLAQTLRTTMTALSFSGDAAEWMPTASFGVAEHRVGEGLYDTIRYAVPMARFTKQEGWTQPRPCNLKHKPISD